MYKVLIADSDHQQALSLSQSINWDEYHMQIDAVLSDGIQALEFLGNHPVDILIVDVMLPGLGGIELLQQIRVNNPYIRCILLGRQENFSFIAKAIPLDIENFLLMPADPQLLHQTILHTMEKLSEHHSEFSGISTGNRNYPPALINHAFEKAMINREYSHCFAYLDNLFSENSSTAATLSATLRNQVVEFTVYIINVLRSCNIEVSDIVEDDSELFHRILRFEEKETLHNWAKDFLSAAVNALESKNLRYSPCISRVVAHIEKNYAQDISLKTMAYELNINAAYLGQLFKAETGQLFSAYLNKTRIDNAKKMLLETNHTLSEVSVQCGYANISYFYNIFRKFTGQTPSQFRKAKSK